MAQTRRSARPAPRRESRRHDYLEKDFHLLGPSPYKANFLQLLSSQFMSWEMQEALIRILGHPLKLCPWCPLQPHQWVKAEQVEFYILTGLRHFLICTGLPQILSPDGRIHLWYSNLMMGVYLMEVVQTGDFRESKNQALGYDMFRSPDCEDHFHGLMEGQHWKLVPRTLSTACVQFLLFRCVQGLFHQMRRVAYHKLARSLKWRPFVKDWVGGRR